MPTEAEVRGYLHTLSNWGRWGDDDMLGTLNFIDQETRLQACRLVKEGLTISLSAPVFYAEEGSGRDSAGHLVPGTALRPIRYMIRGADAAEAGSEQRLATFDGFLIEPHGPLVTHIDAPNHTVYQGTIFNGVPAAGPMGLTESGSIELVQDGIVGRGVLLDLPRAQGRDWMEDGEAAFPEDLEEAERAQGVRVGRGDILIVRTGYRGRNPRGSEPGPNYSRPGLQAACLPWLYEREIALLTSDVPNDARPHPYERLGLPIHTVGMWAMGLWLIDNCNLERLAQHCAATGRYQFLTTLAPLALIHGTGSPINPVCVF